MHNFKNKPPKTANSHETNKQSSKSIDTYKASIHCKALALELNL